MIRARLAVRLAVRELRSDAWRALLSAGLIGLAVALGMLAFASTAGDRSGPDLRIDIKDAKGFSGAGGAASAVVRGGAADRVVLAGAGRRLVLTLDGHGVTSSSAALDGGAPSATVPKGSRVETYRTLGVRLVGRGRASGATVADPAPSGAFHAAGSASSGRRPRVTGEILLTRALARSLRVGIGDRVLAIDPSGRRTLAVVGLGSLPQRLPSGGGSRVDALVPPGTLTGGGGRTWLIRLAHSPFATGSSGGSSGPGVAIAYGGGGHYDALALGFLAVLQVIALALPLYLTVAVLAIGLERRAWRARLLGLAGADGRLITAVAVLRGIVIGAGAASAGTALALALSVWPANGLALDGPGLAVPAALAVAGAIVASLAAARMATRLQDAGPGSGRPPGTGEVAHTLRRAGFAIAGLAGLLALLASGVTGDGAIAVVFVVALLAALPALAGAMIALPALLPLPARLRIASRSLARARWVSSPAAASFAMAALLVIFVLAGAVAAPSPSGTQASSLGDAHAAALAPGLRSTASGAPASPRVAAETAIRGLGAAFLVPVYPLRSGGAGMSVLGPPPVDLALADGLTYVVSPRVLARLAGRGSLPAHAVLALGTHTGTAREVAISSRRLPIVRARPGWPPALPHVFISGDSAELFGAKAGSVPTWIAPTAVAVTDGRASALRAAAAAQGLHAVVAADAAGPQGGLGPGTGRSVALIVAVLGLVFGGVATMLVLAERREDARSFQLAGALPRDQRIQAATTAFFFSGAGAALVALIYAGVAALAWSDGNSDLAGVLGWALLPLVALPLVLAAGAALLTRPSRSLGRIGRVPRAVAGRGA